MCWFFKRKCLGLQKFLPAIHSLLVFAARVVGTYFLAQEPWARRPGVRLGLLTLNIYLLNFDPPHVDLGPAHPHLCPSYQSG